MATFRPDISTSVLRWARMRAGLDLDDFQGALKNYPRWEEGDLNPTFRQLEAVSSKTRTPLGYFFLPEPPEDSIPIPDYRTMDERSVRRPSADLIDTVYGLIRRQDWLRDYRESKGMEPLPFVGSATPDDPPESVAESILTAL
ncbi:DNA-binding protein, partial [Rubrivirga sp. F394]|nr:DNA-binding protein [Rubrivirga sp. F394]